MITTTSQTAGKALLLAPTGQRRIAALADPVLPLTRCIRERLTGSAALTR
jgi:hypothetical protein